MLTISSMSQVLYQIPGIELKTVITFMSLTGQLKTAGNYNDKYKDVSKEVYCLHNYRFQAWLTSGLKLCSQNFMSSHSLTVSSMLGLLFGPLGSPMVPRWSQCELQFLSDTSCSHVNGKTKLFSLLFQQKLPFLSCFSIFEAFFDRNTQNGIHQLA